MIFAGHYVIFKYQFLCVLQGLISARGWCSNGRGRDNAWAEGECIIRSRPLLHCLRALSL